MMVICLKRLVDLNQMYHNSRMHIFNVVYCLVPGSVNIGAIFFIIL